METNLHCLDDLPFSHSFAALPADFYTQLMPTPLPEPYLVCVSASAARLIALDPRECTGETFLQTLTGNRIPATALPLAAAYSGHQFGMWAGPLGDGRAILLGEVPAPDTPFPATMELQLKGAGLTPYSRMGDGRAVLRSSIREFLCSEAMAALGIPTSRALCVTGSDTLVMREIPETAAVTTRMAPSFIRFGSFEHWSYPQQPDHLKTLADYVIARFYPELQQQKNPYSALLTEVTRRTAELIAQWQAVGFMHGVMNTDNMSILGLTMDYGPFGFMEAFDAHHICNHSDQEGRYAYHRQPQIGLWNCHALGAALLPLIGDKETMQAALENYSSAFVTKLDALLHAKLGLQTMQTGDEKLLEAMFAVMQDNRVDFTLFFRRLGELKIDHPATDAAVRDLLIDRAAFDAWAIQYRARLRQENSEDAIRQHAMQAVNPRYILRNHLAQIAIEKAQNKDFSEINQLLAVLEKPFDEQPENAHYADLPPDWATGLKVSCSS